MRILILLFTFCWSFPVIAQSEAHHELEARVLRVSETMASRQSYSQKTVALAAFQQSLEKGGEVSALSVDSDFVFSVELFREFLKPVPLSEWERSKPTTEICKKTLAQISYLAVGAQMEELTPDDYPDEAAVVYGWVSQLCHLK